MAVIDVVLGSPARAFRHALKAELERRGDVRVADDTGEPGRLRVLVANRQPQVVVLDSCWAQPYPDLIAQLLGEASPPRLLLCTDNLALPEVLAAVEQGVQGCMLRDAAADSWHKAILALHAGDTWIPRWLMAEALSDLKQLLPAGLPASLNLERLTERQCEIVRWISQGLSNKEIGRRLGISPTTVKTHLHNIFERVGVSSRQQLALRARGNLAA